MNNVLLFGYGNMGRNHARVLGSIPDVSLLGIVDSGPGRTDALSKGYAAWPHFSDVPIEQIDCAVVATPTTSHLKIASELAERGIPALIEKPVAGTAESAMAVKALFEANGVFAAVGHIERFNPAHRKLKSLLDEGVLGRIHYLKTIRASSRPTRITDVGCVIDLGTHDFDLTRWLTGSEYGILSSTTSSRSDVEFEDFALAIGRLENGIQVSHEISWLSPTKVRKVEVFGEFGSLSSDGISSEVTFNRFGDGETEWEQIANFKGLGLGESLSYAFPKHEPLKLELLEFLAAVNEKPDLSNLATLDDGIEAVIIAEQIIRGPNQSCQTCSAR